MSGTLPAAVAVETQKLSSPDALIHLYHLDTTVIGGTLELFWTPSVDASNPAAPVRIAFGGQEYTPYPIEAEGFEWRGKGPAPRPRIRVSNIENIAGSLVVVSGDLVGAKITRTRTYAKFLDGMPSADPNAYIEPDIWYVERKVQHNPTIIEWELSSILDQQGRYLPSRQLLRDVCTQVYREWNNATGAFSYEGVTCPYVGTSYWSEDDLPTDATRDRCGKRLTSCKLRADASGWSALPTWGFPGLGRAR
jgi:lambda family phage minor tail protein L